MSKFSDQTDEHKNQKPTQKIAHNKKKSNK